MVSIARGLETRPDAWTWRRSDATSARTARAGSTLVLLALAYAAVSQGAFYAGQLRLATLLVLAGLVASIAATGLSRADLGLPTVAAEALAAWYLIAGFVAHHVGGALPAVEVLAAGAAIVAVVRRAEPAERQGLLAGVLALGCGVALVGWEGVVWRQAPRALVDGGLWRAASTITYANATGGLLAALAVLALGWRARNRQERLVLTAAAYTLTVGLGATASRAGLVAFAVGVGWLAIVTRGRVFLTAWPVLLGALIATATLMPSMVASHAARPALAIVGLVVGAVVAIAPARASVVLAVAGALVVVATPGLRSAVTGASGALRRDRVTVSSPDRTNELHAATRLAQRHALTGVGPGRVDLTWDVTQPQPATMHEAYAHDEYLQTVDEAGLPGLLVLVAGVTALALASRRAPRTAATAGAVAALVVLGVHSAFDFLWHVPLIPLTAAVVVGALLAEPPMTMNPNTHGRLDR